MLYNKIRKNNSIGEITLKRLHIFNPKAGGGHSPELLTKGAAYGEETYVTSGIGDAENYIFKICNERPETHFVVYGGDGTVSEAANGIIKANAGDRCLLSVVPAGTGNDFVRSFPEKDAIYQIDAIRYRAYADNDFKDFLYEKYAVNILNFGFDSRVVRKTASYKKVFSGSVAYIAGVADTLFKKMGENWKIELVDEAGNTETLSSEFTLALAANCRYYGGGFCAAPLASHSDGLIDFVGVGKISRGAFIKLVGEYKKGTHLNPATQMPYDKFAKYLTYKRCTAIRISGISDLCADGEIDAAGSVEISIAPKVLRVAT